ncbi:pyridoxal phosphate-dependent aminotransferase [Alphaproteobacteria bacterium]|nr:pyridoxal phosphate-dependent aminotransferase [Alphaproteobacteria bacterium]
MINLCAQAASFSSQPMFQILSRVQQHERLGKRVLRFELGEPDFQTPKHIKQAAIDAISNGDTKYAPSGGLFEFKEAVIGTTLKSRGFSPSHGQILITPGANSIIYFALKCVIEPGDEVVVPDPGFPTYFSAINALGGVAIPIALRPDLQFSFAVEDLKKLVTPRTRAIILNSPGNPTGQQIPLHLMQQAYDLAKKHNILLISDEIYSRLSYGNSEFSSPSLFDECKENVLILNGFSKAFSMTGWRIGVAIGPDNLISAMESLVSTIVSCVPPFIQRAGIQAILGDQTENTAMRREYHNRAKLLVKGLNNIKGIECCMPSGAIYAFPSISGTGLTSAEFCDRLLEKCMISATPGHFFGANGEGYVRFSTVTCEADINLAIKRMTEEFGAKGDLISR